VVLELPHGPWSALFEEESSSRDAVDAPVPERRDAQIIELPTSAPERTVVRTLPLPDNAKVENSDAAETEKMGRCGYGLTGRLPERRQRMTGPTGPAMNALVSIDGRIATQHEALVQATGSVTVTLVDGLTGELVRTEVDTAWLRDDAQSWRWWYARHHGGAEGARIQ